MQLRTTTTTSWPRSVGKQPRNAPRCAVGRRAAHRGARLPRARPARPRCSPTGGSARDEAAGPAPSLAGRGGAGRSSAVATPAPKGTQPAQGPLAAVPPVREGTWCRGAIFPARSPRRRRPRHYPWLRAHVVHRLGRQLPEPARRDGRGSRVPTCRRGEEACELLAGRAWQRAGAAGDAQPPVGAGKTRRESARPA
jgi:hypothetical protein